MNYNEITAGLGAALQSYAPGINIYPDVLRTIVPPAAIVQPMPRNTVEYDRAQGSSLAMWHFEVLFIVGQVDEVSAQRQAGDLISPGSALINAINRATFGRGYAHVTAGSVSQMQSGQTLYTNAQLSVDVLA